MVPRGYGADQSAVFSTAEGIKNKVEQLHRRLQTCVENLEMVSASASQRKPQPLPKQQRHIQNTNVHTYSRRSDVPQAVHTSGVLGHDICDARRTSDEAALHDKASAQHDAQVLRPVASGISGPESWCGPGSDEVEWEETPAGDEQDEGLGMRLDDFEQLRDPTGTTRSARYAANGDAAQATTSVPGATSVSSALRALKHSLSPHVRSSLRGSEVPTHGGQLRVQYQKAIDDTVQKRLLGRADTFHSSGSLSRANSGSRDCIDGGSANSSGGHPTGRESGPGTVNPGVTSPLRTHLTGLLARAVLKTGQEPGQHLQLANRLSIQTASLGEALQLEDGGLSPSSPQQPPDNLCTAVARSKIPPPPAVARCGDGDVTVSTMRVAGELPGRLQKEDVSPFGYASRGASAAGEDRHLQLDADGRADDENAVSASHRAEASVRRQLSKSKDRFPSNGSSGTSRLGWRFSSAESGGVVLISVGSGGIDGDEIRADTRMSPFAVKSVNSPHLFTEPAEDARIEAVPSGCGVPVVGFMPPAELLSGAPPSSNQPAVVGFVPPPDISRGGSAGSSTAVITIPSIGFVPPPEAMGQSTTPATASPRPSGFIPPPELPATARGQSSATSSSGGVLTPDVTPAANGHSSPAKDPPVRLGSLRSEPIQERHAGSMAMRTDDTMRMRTDIPVLHVLSGPAQVLAARLPVGDFSFGINTKVFASSSRLKVRSSTDSLPRGRSGALPTLELDKVNEEDVANADKDPEQSEQPPEAHTFNGTSSTSRGSATAGAAEAGPELVGSCHVNAHVGALLRRRSSGVSDVPSSNEDLQVEPTGKLPWEDSSEDEETGSSETRGPQQAPRPTEGRSVLAGGVLDRGDALGSPFASAVLTAKVAQTVRSDGTSNTSTESSSALGDASKRRPPPRLALSSPTGVAPPALSAIQQKAMGIGSPSDGEGSPLTPNGISMKTSSGDMLASPGREGPVLTAPSLLRPRLSTAGTSPAASGTDTGVSITITDADIARTGGLVPALLEIVRERFRQKGICNLVHMAAANLGVTSVTESGTAPLSPALVGETLAERIVARVETFHTRKSEELALALRPIKDQGSEGLGDRRTDDSDTLDRCSAKQQSITSSPESVKGSLLRHSVSCAAPNAVATAQLSGGGAIAAVASSGTIRFANPIIATSSMRHTGDGSSGRNTPEASPSTASAAEHVNSSSQLATAFGKGSSAFRQASTSSSPAKSDASTPFTSQLPAASRSPPANTPLSAPVAVHALTSPAGGSGLKAEQGTQTGTLPLESPVAPDEILQVSLGTAQEYFLSTTVPLTGRRTGTRGGAYNDAEKLLQTESPTICTAADFFRGAATRATINTSTIASPLQQRPDVPSAVSPFAAAAAAAEAALAGGKSPRGASGSVRPRSGRDSTAYPQTAPLARSRQQSTSGRVSISTAGLLGSSGGPMSSGGGRVMIGKEPVDMDTPSSSRATYPYFSRRPSTAAVAWAPGRVAFEDISDGEAGPTAGPGSCPEGIGGRRALTREMLMRLAHLGRESRQDFEGTTDEECEERQRQEARWRAQRNRPSVGRQSAHRRATGEDACPTGVAVGPRLRAHDKMESAAKPQTRDQHNSGHDHVHFRGIACTSSGVGAAISIARGAPPRQLAVVAAIDPGEGDTCNSSPAIAAASGELINLPPLSLDAPDMPEPCGGDAPACSVISPVARSQATGRSSGVTGSGPLSQLPHETVFIPPASGWAHSCPKGEGPTGANVAIPAIALASRRAVKSVGGNALGGAGAMAGPRTGHLQVSRLSRGIIATEGGSRHRQPHRGYRAVTLNNTLSWSDSSGTSGEDVEEDDGDSSKGEEGALEPQQTQESEQHRYHEAGSASVTSGARAKRTAGLKALGPAPPAAAHGLGDRRGTSAEWELEEGLPCVPFDSFEIDVDGPESVDREPSPLSLSRSAISPPSGAASMLSQSRYVAAARAHRSVSEANSIKPLSSGALPQDGYYVDAQEADDLSAEGYVAAEATGNDRGGGPGSRGASILRCQSRISNDRDGDEERGMEQEAEERVRQRRGKELNPPAKSDMVASGKHLVGLTAQEMGQGSLGRWHSAQGDEAEPAVNSSIPNGSRIRQSLQRLLDLRSFAASSGQVQSASSTASEQSGAVVPTPKRPVVVAHTNTSKRIAVTMQDAKIDKDMDESSPSPSVTATVGGTTEADAAERDAPLRSARGGAHACKGGRDAAPTPRWQQTPTTLLQQHRRHSGGSEASRSDGPPEDPVGLVFPNYTQDMAEEEYGWDVATGDADVDNLTSPRGGQPQATGASGGAPARRDRKPPVPTLPYDPAEVPFADMDEACPNFTRDLEQQVLLDAVSELLGSRSCQGSESLPSAAEQEPSFSLDPIARGGVTGPPSASASKRSSPSLIPGSWRGSPRSGSSPRVAIQHTVVEGSPQLAITTPHNTIEGSTVVPPPSAEAWPEKAGTAPGSTEPPSWLSTVLGSTRLGRHEATAAALAAIVGPAQPPSDGASADGGSGAAPAEVSAPQKQSSSHAIRTALADLLAAMQPLALRTASVAGAHPDSTTLVTMRISLEDAAVRGPAARSPRSASRFNELSRDSALGAVDDDGMAGGRSSMSSVPDPELRRLLLTAWSRWYLRKNLGLYAGNQADEAAAAAAARARLQSQASAHSRAGSEAWDGVSPSIDLMEAANDSRLHVAFIRWLGHVRACRRSKAAVGRCWAEPRNTRSWSSALTAPGPTNIAPPYPTSLSALPVQPAVPASARPPSAPQSARPVETAWFVAPLRAPAAPPPQPISLHYGSVSQFTHQYNGASSVVIPSSPRTAGAMGIGSYGSAATRPANSSAFTTPTVSRTSGVRQVPSQPQQPQQRQVSRQQSQPPSAAIQQSPRQQQQQPQRPIPSLQPTAPHITTWGSSLQHHQRPSTPRSLLEQHPTGAVLTAAAAVPTGNLSGSHLSTATAPSHPGPMTAAAAHTSHFDSGAIDSARDLESLIALRLLDGLGSGRDGVILAGLELATGGVFEPDKNSIRAPIPRMGSGAGDATSAVTATGAGTMSMLTVAAQGAPGSTWTRPASTSRTGSSSSSQHTVMYGASVLGGGAGGGSGGSILERPLLAVQQPHSPGTGSVSGSGRARTTVSPRLGTVSGGGTSSAGGSFVRASASPRPASPRPGTTSVGLVGYSGMEAVGGGVLLGNSNLVRPQASPRLGTGSSGSGSSGNRFDLLRAAPPSPRSTTVGFPSSGALHPGATASHGGLLRPGSLGGAGSIGGGRLQVPYASPRSPMQAGILASNDNIRANESGPDKLNFAYYGLRP